MKVYWNRALASFQKSESPEAGGVDPEIAALMKNVKMATSPEGNGGKKSVSSKEPAAIVKPVGGEAVRPKEVAPVTTPDETKKVVVPSPPPALPQDETKSPVANVAANGAAPAPPSLVETTMKPEISAPATADSHKEKVEPAAPGSADPPVKKALPVEPVEPPVKTPGAPLPEKLAPVPPSATPTALVEVSPSGKGGTNTVAPGEEKSVFIKASADAKPAAEILNKFFQAATWQERLLLTQPQEKVRPLMERYYADNPDGPVRVSSIELIRHEKAPEIGTPLCVFQVSGPDLPEPLPVMVESSPDGWKVDWLAFTEFKDKLLLRYLQKWQDEPARFHVMVRRTHYFDEDVPSLDKKHCFELMPPTPGYSGFAFVTKASPLAQNLDRSIGWEVANVAAIVELRWRKQDRYQWVEITAVPQFNWRSTLPAIPIAQPAKLAPESGTDTMPAGPVSPPKAQAVAEKK